jgi:hypothetical protein
MKFVARLLSVIALLGMLVFPVSVVASENAMAAAQAHAAAMQAMDDMPCCPKPSKPDCGMDCPLVIVCASSAAAHVAKADWVPVTLGWSAFEFNRTAHTALASLHPEPPARPPSI